MSALRRMPFAVLLLLAVAGCGDDEAEDKGLKSGLEGIYAIQTWTINSMGCDAEGQSVLETEPRKKLAVQVQTFGNEYLLTVPCSDAADCAEVLGSGPFAVLFGGAAFIEGSDSAGWTGTSTSWIFSDGRCVGQVLEHQLTGKAKETVRLETRGSSVDIPADSEAACDGEKVEAAAASQPCAGLQVITGVYENEPPPPPE